MEGHPKQPGQEPASKRASVLVPAFGGLFIAFMYAPVAGDWLALLYFPFGAAWIGYWAHESQTWEWSARHPLINAAVIGVLVGASLGGVMSLVEREEGQSVVLQTAILGGVFGWGVVAYVKYVLPAWYDW